MEDFKGRGKYPLNQSDVSLRVAAIACVSLLLLPVGFSFASVPGPAVSSVAAELLRTCLHFCFHFLF